MVANRYIYSSYEVNFAILRFWGDKPSALLDILHFDTPVGWYVFEGFHTEAISAGFDIVDENGNKTQEWNDYDPDLLRDTIEKYNKGIAEANKQYVVFGMFDFGKGEKFYFISDKYINELELEPGTKKITKLVINNPLEEPRLSVSRMPIPITGKALDKVFFVGEYDRRLGKFRSRYESLVDGLIGLAIIDQQLILLVTRVGSGNRYVLVREDLLADKKERQKMEDAVENMGGNLFMVIPVSSLDEDGFQFKLDFGEGSPPVDWEISRANIIKGICIRLGIALEWLDGANIGLRGGEVNDRRSLRSFGQEQERHSRNIMRALAMAADMGTTEEAWGEKAKVKWKPFVDIDETSRVNTYLLVVQALRESLQIQQQAGMPLEWILDKLDLDYEPDASLIAEFEEMRTMMQEGFNGGNGEGIANSTENGSRTPSDARNDSQDKQRQSTQTRE